jgi:hypothetical protein
MKIIKYLTPKKIPRGRSKNKSSIKISTTTNLQEQSKTSILQKKIISTNFNEQISSSISNEQGQLVPKNFASLLTVYYMKIHQNSNFQIINKLTNFRKGANKIKH